MTRSVSRLVVVGIAGAVLVLFVIVHAGSDEAVDAYVYWSADLEFLYQPKSTSGDQTYQYSPAFAQAFAPLSLMPFQLFQTVWLAVQAGVLAWLVGPVIAAVLVLSPWTHVADELVLGNVHTLLAASVVVGFVKPVVYALPLFTKVTPAVGLAWHLARGNQRRLATALAMLALTAVVSIALAPAIWLEWIKWLVTRPEPPDNPHELMAFAPLWARLPVAAAMTLVASKRNAPWILPFAVWLALPIIWYNSLVVLAAAIPLAWAEVEQRVPFARALRPPAFLFLTARQSP